MRAFVIPLRDHPAEKFADDVQPSFHIETLDTLPNVTLWQVTAKQANSHEVVWLAAGRNPVTGRFMFSAVRIATEFGEYAGCGSGRDEPSAASIERQPGSLQTLLDVEPSHRFDLEGKLQDLGDPGETVTICPVQIKLFWNNSLGFVREAASSDSACPATTRPRVLTISDTGEITIKPPDPNQ